MSSGKVDGVDLENILDQIGQFGRYQILTYSVILWPILFSAVYSSQYVFNAAAVPSRCLVPQCEASPPEYASTDWSNWAYPPSGGECQKYTATGSECKPGSFSTQIEKCSSWVYENHNSIVAEFGMACQEWKRTLVGTMHSVGLFAALPLTGYVSDTFGRRTAFILTAVAAGVAGLIRSFSNGYIMYVIMEFVEATVGSGVYSTGFILALEMVGLERRVLGGNIISSFFALGQIVCALIAWASPYWRTFTRIIYAPSLLFIFYYFIIEESVRWLLSNGNKKEAARIIFKAAKMNKRELSPEFIKQLSESPIDSKNTSQEQVTTSEELKSSSLTMQVLRSRIIMSRLAICSFWWITVTLTYYGLSINSVSLAGNKYVNYILTSLVEIPGYVLSVLTLDRFGRKSSIMTAFIICAVSLISLPFVPSELEWLQVCLNMVGKLNISMVFSSIYIYTSELFPTSARHRLLGFCSMVGRIGSIVAPQTPLLMAYWDSLPYLLFGVMSGCSGLLVLLTPETLRTQLPDTVKQAENIAACSRPSKPKPKTDIIIE